VVRYDVTVEAGFDRPVPVGWSAAHGPRFAGVASSSSVLIFATMASVDRP
jgi:hypothetical protein